MNVATVVDTFPNETASVKPSSLLNFWVFTPSSPVTALRYRRGPGARPGLLMSLGTV